MDGPIRRFKAVPIEFGVEAQTVGRDLLFGQLARLPQPAVRVGIKTTPIKERVEVDRLAAYEDGVLLKAALQLGIRLDGNGLGHGGQGAEQGRRSYRHSATETRVHSHSIVPGGLLVMSSTTRLTPLTSLTMRLEICSSRS